MSEDCEHAEWNVILEVKLITEPPMAAGNYLVHFVVSCGYCGLELKSVDDGKVLPYLETVMFR